MPSHLSKIYFNQAKCEIIHPGTKIVHPAYEGGEEALSWFETIQRKTLWNELSPLRVPTILSTNKKLILIDESGKNPSLLTKQNANTEGKKK